MNKANRHIHRDSRDMSSNNQPSLSPRRLPPKPPSGSSTSLTGPSYDQLKLKHMTVDRNYQTLKELSRKGEQLQTNALHALHGAVVLLFLHKKSCRAKGSNYKGRL